MIVIVDYGMGNLLSIKKAFARAGFKTMISSNLQEISSASKIVLPGVGHFKQGMENLSKIGALDTLNNAVINRKVPILGICLGMQIMTKSSAEGGIDGLGWVDLKVTRVKEKNLKTPHMGWNSVCDFDSLLMKNIDKESLFYFVHSYQVLDVNNHSLNTGLTFYGSDFISCFSSGNIHGVQFHPEKSHKQGIEMLKNFANL
jgi:imidazole glycerol-phosphate synthase subunit HisH